MFAFILAICLIVFVVLIAIKSKSPYLIAYLAVLSAVFSRLLVSWELIPGIMNFLHFPLVILATIFAVLIPHSNFKLLTNRLLTLVSILGILILVSWIFHPTEFIKPILLWLLFVEPFLIIYVIVKTLPKSKIQNFYNLALFLCYVQIPFAYLQSATLGLGDVVEGTFVGHGAGAHILGAIIMMGIIILFSEFISQKKVSNLLKIFLLFPIPILSDAKQVFIAAILAFLFLFFKYTKLNLYIIFSGSLIIIAIYFAIYLYPPLNFVLNLDFLNRVLSGKLLSFLIILQNMGKNYLDFLIGLGPGQSVSRIALAAQEGYIRSLSANFLKLNLSSTTEEIVSLTFNNPILISSVWSGVSSWIGLFGDLGFFGVVVYGLILLILWQRLKQIYSPIGYSGRAILIMGILLGLTFSWLETPEFTLPWALYLSIGLFRGIRS